MRNLKRALSLTLASVMLLGMMVVGSSAAGFPDVDKEDNVEAIEVLNAVEVILGYDNGNFGPDDLVTRAQMAVIMAKLLNLDYQYYESSCPFNDVDAWARGYVGACYANGIVSGYNATTYGANDGITPVQAASMMMRALGYFKYAEDYKDGFELVTVRQGTEVGIFDGVGSSATAQMTRDQVAKMALNALQSEMVTFTGTPGMEVNGVTVGYRAEYTPRTSTEAKYQAIEKRTSDVQNNTNVNRGQYYVQLGEELYNGELRLTENDRDAFQRPARTWEYKGEQIGTYVKKELLRRSYSDKITGRDLYDLLSANTIANYNFVIAFDGEMDNAVLDQVSNGQNPFFTEDNLVRTNTETIGRTGKGVTTEVYVDTNLSIVYIAVMNTYLAKANEDYNTRDEDVDLTVYGVDFVAGGNALVKDVSDSNSNLSGKQPYTEILTAELEDFDMVGDVKKDDILLVRVAEGGIQVLETPETLSAVNLNSFSKGNYVTTGGEQYDYAHTALYDPETLDAYTSTAGGNVNLKDLTYNVYLDEYGYLIGVKRVEDPTQYVFITGTDGGYSDMYSSQTAMRAIFTDGTTDVITVNMVKSDATVNRAFRNMGPIINTWCTYTVDGNNVYTLRAVPTAIGTGKVAQWAQNAYTTTNDGSSAGLRGTSSYTIDKGHINLVANDGTNDIRVYGNDDTIYINAEMSIINARTTLASDNTGAYRWGDTDRGNGLTDGIGYGWGTAAVANKSAAEKLDTNYVKSGAGVAGQNPRTAIINDVDSVTIGVANTSIKAVSLSEANLEQTLENGQGTNNVAGDLIFPKSEIYTLYNDNGVVIAAVVLGNDQGTSTKLAVFPNSEPSVETWVADSSNRATTTDGYWTWSRDAIIDGEVVTLTETGDNLYALSAANIGMGDLAEIRYDADGNVRRADNLTKFNQNTHQMTANIFTNGLGKYTTDIQSVEKSAEAHDTMVLYADYTNGAKLVYSNGTLFRDNTNTKGVYCQNAKIIVANAKLKNNNTGVLGNINDVDQYKTITKTYTGTNAMTEALNAMDNNFHGYVVAIVQDHVATSVILNNTYGERVKTTGGSNLTGGKIDSITSNGVGSYVYHYYDPTGTMSVASLRDQAATALSAYFGGARVLRNNMSFSASPAGTVALERYDGDYMGEVMTLSVQPTAAIRLNGTILGYVDKGITLSNTQPWQLNTISGLTVGADYLAGKKVGTTLWNTTPITTTTVDVSGVVTADVTLYPAYAITLGTGVTASYVDVDNVTYSISGSGNYVAEGTRLTLANTSCTATTTTYGVEEVANGVTTTIAQVVGTASGITTNYTVSKTATLQTTTGGTAIKVRFNGGVEDMIVAPTTVTFQDLADKVNLPTNQIGGYLVDTTVAVDGTDSMGKAVTLASMNDAIDGTGAFIQPGHIYEFGYYKVTMQTAPADLVDTTMLVNGKVAWSVDGKNTVADGKSYFVKMGQTVVATLTADSATANVDDATIAGGTGAVANVVSATLANTVADAAITANDATVTIAKNTSVYSGVTLTFTWKVAADLSTELVITTTNA